MLLKRSNWQRSREPQSALDIRQAQLASLLSILLNWQRLTEVEVSQGRLTEPILASLAELALGVSVLRRKTTTTSLENLRVGIAGLLAQPHFREQMLRPGPAAWACFASVGWLEPRALLRILARDARRRDSFEESTRQVLAIGPSWRSLEVNHLTKVLGSREVDDAHFENFACELLKRGTSGYELTHIAFYLTDFGEKLPSPGLVSDLRRELASSLSAVESTGVDFDLGVELILAATYMGMRRSGSISGWINTGIEYLIERTLETCPKSPPATFDLLLSSYHPVLLSSILLALHTRAREARSEEESGNDRK